MCTESKARAFRLEDKELESGTVLMEMKDGEYEALGPEDILSL